MKILKRRVEKEKEKTYAVGKGLRLGSWEPAQVAETDEEREQFDIEIPDAPPEERKKEKTPEKVKPTRKTVLRKKVHGCTQGGTESRSAFKGDYGSKGKHPTPRHYYVFGEFDEAHVPKPTYK